MQFKVSLKLSFAAALTLLALPVQSIHAEDEVRTGQQKIFFSAPSPEQLAGILFPPRYRGAKPAEPQTGQQPIFGMMINFDFDSTNILQESEPMLQSLGEMMGIDQASRESIVIEGHTDAVGTDAYNQQLSERRAKAIKDYLVKNYGIASKRLVAIGKGERQPASKDDPAASVNRRATFRPAKKLILK